MQMCCRWPKLISLWSPVMQLHPEKISFQSGFCALDPSLSCFLKISACWLESRALSHTRKSLGKSEIDLQRDQIMRGHPEDSLTERKRKKNTIVWTSVDFWQFACNMLFLVGTSGYFIAKRIKGYLTSM